MGDVKGTMFSEALSLRHKKSRQLHKQEAAANLERQLLFCHNSCNVTTSDGSQWNQLLELSSVSCWHSAASDSCHFQIGRTEKMFQAFSSSNLVFQWQVQALFLSHYRMLKSLLVDK